MVRQICGKYVHDSTFIDHVNAKLGITFLFQQGFFFQLRSYLAGSRKKHWLNFILHGLLIAWDPPKQF